jgi:pleiotropic regulator 1
LRHTNLGYRNKIKLATKLAAEYKDVQTLPPVLAAQQAGPTGPKRPTQAGTGTAGPGVKLIGGIEGPTSLVISSSLPLHLAEESMLDRSTSDPASEPRSLVKFRHQQGFAAEGGHTGSKLSQALMRKKEAREIKPKYHAQCGFLYQVKGFVLMAENRETIESHFWPYGLGQSYSG